MKKEFHCINSKCKNVFMTEPKPVRMITVFSRATKKEETFPVRDLSTICPKCGDRASTKYFKLGG